MVAVQKEKVCVTGAGGFLGSWVVDLLLSRDYFVHGTVRDPATMMMDPTMVDYHLQLRSAGPKTVVWILTRRLSSAFVGLDSAFQVGRLINIMFDRNMDSHGMSKRDRRGRQKNWRNKSNYRPESEFYTSDSYGFDDLLFPMSPRRWKGSRSCRTQCHTSNDDFTYSDDGRTGRVKRKFHLKDFSEKKL